MDFLNPSEILNKLELTENMVAADFGCGSGGWVIPLAKKLEEGKVYAVDVLREPLSALESKVKAEKILNIEIVQTDVEKGTALHSDSCDLVLMTNLLFECYDKKGVLLEGKRVLRPDGKILVVDWKVSASLGPKEGRVSAKEVKKIAEELGLNLEKELEAGVHHYGLVFSK